MRERHAKGVGLVKNKSVLQLERSRQPETLQSQVADLATRAYTPSAPQTAASVSNTQRLGLWRLRIVALLRVLCGIFCLGDAWMKWHGSFTNGYLSMLSQVAGGHTPVIATWFSWWLQLAQLHTQAFITATLLMEICLGICLICGALTTFSCLMGMFLTALGGIGAGLFSGFFGQGSLDIGVLVVFLLAFLGLMLSQAGRYAGLDRWLRPGQTSL